MELTIRAGTHPYTYTLESGLRGQAASRRAAHGRLPENRQTEARHQDRRMMPRIASALGLA